MRSGAVSAPEEFDRCTEFTTDHGLDATEDSDIFGAAICPGCAKRNPLLGDPSTGDPLNFRGQVVRCLRCTHVMILDGASLLSFAVEADESGRESLPGETDELPFACMWEVGVSETGDPDTWEHHHPRATTPDDAEKQAQRASDLFDPIVYMCEGPFKPDDVQELAGVDTELIAEVFGHE